MKKKRFLLTILACCGFMLTVQAQRHTDKLNRGLVAVPAQSGGGNLVSWRIFAEEYYDTAYNLYCNGTKLNNTPLKVSNFVHSSGNASSQYQVAAVVKGVEQEKCDAVTRWNNGYYDISVATVTDRTGATVTSQYILNDVSLADVTGNGVSEFIVKRNYTGDIRNASNTTKFNHYECYTLTGKRLWWIDLGPNMMAGPDEQWDIVAFDWDRDGKAECIMRGADNMVIHTASGKTINIGNMSYVAPRDEYTNQGAEYLLYLNGETGEPYGWDGSSTAFTPMAYPLPRFETGEAANPLNATDQEYTAVWGTSSNGGKDTGHRSSKHYFGAPFLDGRHASIFLGRGCYTQHKMCALDVNPATHALTIRWRWANKNGWSDPWYGNGFHNFAIADVDWDGRDEIVFGSMIIDDNGYGLCTTGLGHGDAQHCSDLDPYRHGQEQFTCNEDEPACTYYNATTGQIYYRLQSTSDDGRALCGNFSNSYPGSVGRTTQTGLVSTVADKIIDNAQGLDGTNDAFYWSHLNQRIYWDGDLCDEVYDSPGSSDDGRAAAIYKFPNGRLFNSDGCLTINGKKNNACAIGDIFGDWREEIVMRTSDNTALRIFTTNYSTNYRVYTLWHDHQYRNAMVWQCVGYNQPPHKSYFLGEMEGITQAPPPLTMTGRTEIKNGGTISSANDDQHVMVCETNDTEITVADGAKPYIATFNIPSHVEGTNSSLLNGKARINYKYFTCTVSGGAFTGDMRLVKQGDGILTLPAVEQTYTGNTDIWAGTVNFNGKLMQSDLWLNRFAELNSDGGEFKSIKMDYDAKLRPGGADHKGTLSVDDMKLGFGARVVFDVYSQDLEADLLKVGKLSIETKNWTYGPKYLTPVFEFMPHLGEDGKMAEGRYLIAEVAELTGSLSAVKIEGLPSSQKALLVLDGNKLYLEVSGLRDAATVYWTGNESAIWDMGTSMNFSNGNNEGETFVSGDKVFFTDNAQQFNVTLNGEIEADSIIVDNSKSYTFGGTGAIVGKSVLVKRGTGTLTINTDNTYTGGTRISGGTVVVSSLSNTNQPKGNLGAVVGSNKFVIENGAELRTTTSVTQGSTMTMATVAGGVIQNTQDFIVNRAILGTKLTKKGSGWMKLNVPNANLDTMVVAGGTVQCVACNMPAKTVVMQRGTLSENTGTSYAIHVPEGGSGTQNLVNDATYTNKLTGSGTMTISCPVRSGGSGDNKWYATRTHVSGDWSAFEGTVKPVSNGDPGGRFSLDNAKGLAKGTLDIASGVEVQNSGKTFAVGCVTGKGSLGGSCTFSNNSSVGANTWKVGNDEGWSWDGTVVSNANFTKVGAGRMTVKGVWTTTGNVKVSEGELAIGSSAQLGTGTLTVDKGATLSGSTSSSNALKNKSVTVNGTIQVGATRTSTTGTMNMGNVNVSFAKGSTYVVGAARAATSTTNGCTSMKGIKLLTMNGTISVFLSDNQTLAAGDCIRLWEAESMTGTPSFDLPEIGNSLTWDTSHISEGLLYVVTIPDDIESVLADSPQGCDVYNAGGQLIRKHARTLNDLPSGIYFVKGRKIVVKSPLR